jgi:hypothetical protein
MIAKNTLAPGHRIVRRIGESVPVCRDDEEQMKCSSFSPSAGNRMPSERFGLHEKASGEWR